MRMFTSAPILAAPPAFPPMPSPFFSASPSFPVAAPLLPPQPVFSAPLMSPTPFAPSPQFAPMTSPFPITSPILSSPASFPFSPPVPLLGTGMLFGLGSSPIFPPPASFPFSSSAPLLGTGALFGMGSDFSFGSYPTTAIPPSPTCCAPAQSPPLQVEEDPTPRVVSETVVSQTPLPEPWTTVECVVREPGWPRYGALSPRPAAAAYSANDTDFQSSGSPAATTEGGPPWFGVLLKWLDDMDRGGHDNVAVVHEVVPNSPAAKAGIRADDQLEYWNGERIDSEDKWKAKVARLRVGDIVSISLSRNGRDQEAIVKVEAATQLKGVKRIVRSKTEVHTH